MRIFLKPKNDSHWHTLFWYEPSTGNLVNRIGRGTRAKAGETAGCCKRKDGYVQIGLFGKYHNAHRIIWEMVHGPVPDGVEIDHINGEGRDNRLANLRLVSHGENMRNRKRQCNNTSGFMGVCRLNASKFAAQIRVDGSRKYLGSFATAEQAYQAYIAAAREFGYHENHGRSPK